MFAGRSQSTHSWRQRVRDVPAPRIVVRASHFALAALGALASLEVEVKKLQDPAAQKRAASLHGVVESCALQRFQRFAAAMVVGAAVLRWLFQPPIDGHRPPPVLRAYIQDCAFISPGCAKAGD